MSEITVTRIETEYDREGHVIGAHEVPIEIGSPRRPARRRPARWLGVN